MIKEGLQHQDRLELNVDLPEQKIILHTVGEEQKAKLLEGLKLNQ